MEPLNALLPLLSAGILLVVWLSVIRDKFVVIAAAAAVFVFVVVAVVVVVVVGVVVAVVVCVSPET